MASPTHSHGTHLVRRSSFPRNAPGRPHPLPTVAAPSYTTRPLVPNAPGSLEGTQQRLLSLSPASFSTSQTPRTAGCRVDVSGTASGVITGKFLSPWLLIAHPLARSRHLPPVSTRLHSSLLPSPVLYHSFVTWSADTQLCSGAPLGEVFYPCSKHNRHGDSLPMFTFDMAYVTALGAPTNPITTTTTTAAAADDPSTPSSPLSPSSQSSSLRTLSPPSPRISTRHPPIVVSGTPNNPYVPTGAYPPTLPTVSGSRPVIMARTHHPAQRPPPLPRPHRSPSCPGTPHDSEEDSSGSEEETTGGSGSGSYSDESLPMTTGANPTPSPPRSNSQSSLQSC